ncbi:YciI-related domain-containing protein (plasmid) [Rhizobium etli bv. phaseoli str. IE4803]|nr:YciI-related domain-containing protein [Rhizobium etli bv. phaseoli str. IE4803]
MADLGNPSVAELLARMVAKEFYLIENCLLAEVTELATKLREHLLYMIDLEKAGVLFLSGPLYDETGAMTGGGVTIVRASSFEEAERIALNDPFVVAGYRKPKIRRWVVNEGRVSLCLDLSDGKVSID